MKRDFSSRQCWAYACCCAVVLAAVTAVAARQGPEELRDSFDYEDEYHVYEHK